MNQELSSLLAARDQHRELETCDEATILKHRAQVEAEFSIRLMLPSELVREIQQGGFITT